MPYHGKPGLGACMYTHTHIGNRPLGPRSICEKPLAQFSSQGLSRTENKICLHVAGRTQPGPCELSGQYWGRGQSHVLQCQG